MTRGVRALIRPGLWRDHYRDLAAIIYGQTDMVYSPVGTAADQERFRERKRMRRRRASVS